MWQTEQEKDFYVNLINVKYNEAINYLHTHVIRYNN